MNIRPIALVSTFVLLGLVATGCAQAPIAAAPAPAKPAAGPSYPPLVGQMVAATKKQIKTINLQQFKEAYERKQVGLLVDVREEDEFDDGHVPGAINVPRGLIEFRIWKHVGFPDKTDTATPMMLYCQTGGRCALATKSLQDLGFTNVTAVDMKFEEWEKAGNPVTRPTKK